jgi:hypothetical protein
MKNLMNEHEKLWPQFKWTINIYDYIRSAGKRYASLKDYQKKKKKKNK